MIIEELNNQILAKWKNLVQMKENNHYPSLYHDLNFECDILFVGMNPSAPDEQDIPNMEANIPVEKIMEREKTMIHGYGSDRKGQYKKYFGLFNKFETLAGLSWEHIDLFHLRHTTQSEIEFYLNENDDLIDFELKLFASILPYFKTNTVFVNNRKGGEHLKSFLQLEYNSENDWYENPKRFNKIFILEKYQQGHGPSYEERVKSQYPRILKSIKSAKQKQ